MTYPSWKENSTKCMTERQILEKILELIDALKIMFSRDTSGLMAMAGDETNWGAMEQCARYLRKKLQELKAQKPA